MAAAALSLPLLVPQAASHLGSVPLVGTVLTTSATRAGAAIEPAAGAALLPGRRAFTIRVNPGDTLETLATEFHSDAATLRWANDLRDVAQPAAGSLLIVPPGPGSLVEVQPGERPSAFAARLGLPPRVLLDYNTLRSDEPRPAGTFLQVPREVAPAGSLTAADVVPVASGTPGVPSTQFQEAMPAGRYAWGQCTYWVWTKRYVPWAGDAWEWYANARGYGRPEGRVPVVGAIAVMWGSWVGHVAFVEKVNPDGSFVVSEMNVEGLGVVDHRTLTVGGIDLIGFIY